MKTRIVSSLYQFSLDTTSDKAMELLKDVAFETKLSIATLKINRKPSLKISFIIMRRLIFQRLINSHKSHPNVCTRFEFATNFEVSLETDSLLQEAIDLVISKAGDDPNLTKLLIEFSKEKQMTIKLGHFCRIIKGGPTDYKRKQFGRN